jgi:hypothetical protein
VSSSQGRLTGALGAYYSSPVVAGGYLYFTSERGAIAVLPPGGDLTPVVASRRRHLCDARVCRRQGYMHGRGATR